MTGDNDAKSDSTLNAEEKFSIKQEETKAQHVPKFSDPKSSSVYSKNNEKYWECYKCHEVNKT